MRTIRIPDPRLLGSEKTYFDSDYNPTVNGTSLSVTNDIGFNMNDIAVAGEPGEEHSEGQQVISGSPPSAMTIGASYLYSHNKGVTLYKTVWNQVSIEGFTGSNNWAVITLMNIQWDSTETLYFHQLGDDTWNYRFRFFNSYTNTYSEYSPTIPGSGFTRQQVGQMIINVRRKVRDPNANRFQDSDILILLQDAQTQIEMIVPKLFFLQVDTFEQQPQTGIAAVAGKYKYPLNVYPNLNYLHKIRYLYNNGSVNLLWDLQPLPETEYDRYTVNQNRISDDNVRRYKLLQPDSNSLQGYFETFPTPLLGGGTLFPIYYRELTDLTDVASTTDLPFPEILEDYAAWRMHIALGNDVQATSYENLFYGPDQVGPSIHLTGIALLKEYDKNRRLALGYGRNLWRWRGQRGRDNFFSNGLVTRDFIKEYYM